MIRHHLFGVAAALALVGCASTTPDDAAAVDAQAQVEAQADTAPDTVFEHYDENDDGILSAAEFRRAYRFDPSRDCNFRSDVINDPRCDPFRSRRGPMLRR